MIIRDISSGLVPIAEYENALKSLIFGEAAAKLHVKSTKVVEDNFAQCIATGIIAISQSIYCRFGKEHLPRSMCV